MGRPALDQEEVEAFQESLCDAAIGVLLDHGYEGLSLRKLSRELGCSHAKVYRYFGSKDDLVEHVRARSFRRYGVYLRGQLAGLGEPVERLRAVCMGYVAYAIEHAQEFRLMFAWRRPLKEEGDSQLREAAREAWSVVLEIVQEAIEAGDITGKPTEVAHVLWAGMHGVAALQQADKLIWGIDERALAALTWESLLRSFRADAPSSDHREFHQLRTQQTTETS